MCYVRLARGRLISDRSSHPILSGVILREKQKQSQDWAKFRQLPWGWRLALCVWKHGVYTNIVTFLSLQHLQKLCSLLGVGGSGIVFLVDQGTDFLGNGLRRHYFHNSHPQGLEEGKRAGFMRLGLIKSKI